MNFTVPAGTDLVFTDPVGTPLETPRHIALDRTIISSDDAPTAT